MSSSVLAGGPSLRMPLVSTSLRGVLLVAVYATAVGVGPGTMRASPAVARRYAEPDPTLRPRRQGDGPPAGRTPLDVRLGGERLAFALASFPLSPQQGILIEGRGEEALALRYQAGDAVAVENGWRWIAPARPGIYALKLVMAGDTIDLTALVLYPATMVRNGTLNGYRIGKYQAKPLRGDPSYLPPDGFLEVAIADRDVLASPHFVLGDFLCKQPGEPRYIALSPQLLMKLESITEALQERGLPSGALRVMSGYRTRGTAGPSANARIYSGICGAMRPTSTWTSTVTGRWTI